jgi:hypothetical protein
MTTSKDVRPGQTGTPASGKGAPKVETGSASAQSATTAGQAKSGASVPQPPAPREGMPAPGGSGSMPAADAKAPANVPPAGAETTRSAAPDRPETSTAGKASAEGASNVVPAPVRPAAPVTRLVTKTAVAEQAAAGVRKRAKSPAIGKETAMTKTTTIPAGKKAGAKKTEGAMGPFMFPAMFPATFPAFETLFPGLEKLSTFKGLEGFKGFEGMAEQGAENLKAAVAASAAFIKVVDALTKEMATFTTDSVSAGITAAREISECKTMGDVFERQTAFARAVLERMISESAKLSRLSVDAAKETMVPLNVRMEEATEKFMKAMAA